MPSTTNTQGIGFDATPALATAAWTAWKSSDDGTNPMFNIPAAGMENKVYRARVNLITEAGATTPVDVLSYRLNAVTLMTVHFSGVLVGSNANGTDVNQIDAPTGSAPLEAQIHWAVPYDLNEWADDGAMNATDWKTVIGDFPSVPLDGRDYNMIMDGGDFSDVYDLLMTYFIVEAYARPTDETTPDQE